MEVSGFERALRAEIARLREEKATVCYVMGLHPDGSHEMLEVLSVQQTGNGIVVTVAPSQRIAARSRGEEK